MVEPRLDKSESHVSLDHAPPSPPTKRAKTMMDTGEPDEDEGVGPMGATPQAKALQGLKMAQQGVQMLSLVLPNLAPQLGDFLNQLQQVTVNAVASMSSGGSAAPGIAPMAPPPPPMPMTGAPPAAVPGMAGGM